MFFNLIGIQELNLLKNEFSKSFKLADEVVLCPIYSAGEKIDHNLMITIYLET